MRKKTNSKLSTLQKILLICVCLGVYAMIYLPSYLFAQIMGKVAETRENFNSSAIALEKYYGDYKIFPPAASPSIFSSSPEFSFGIIPSVLTTPVPFLEEFLEDIFGKKNEMIRYGTDGKFWILISNGPDEKPDLFLNDMENLKYGGVDLNQGYGTTSFLSDIVELQPFTYDPTNGGKSTGDVWRVGP